VTQPATTQELIADVLLPYFGDDETAYTAAAAITQDPALTVRPRRILSGEWRYVMAALDALPRLTVIKWQSHEGPTVAINRHGRWIEAGYSVARTSESIARDNTPIKVIA